MKKLLCVFLSAILVFSMAGTALASTEDAAAVREVTFVETDTPVIVVRGMNFTGGLQYDRGTENATAVSPKFEVTELFAYLAKTFAAVVTSFSIKAGISVVCEYVVELFGDYPCDNNGNSLHTNITAAYYPEAVSNYPELLNEDAVDEFGLVTALAARYGADKVYYFDYDWRLDPMDNADLLDKMVKTATEDHGCEKVDIICCSMGGSVAIAYMAEYGYDRIDTLVSNTSVMFGADVITDLFQGKVEFDAATVENYVATMVPSLAGFIRFASATGTLKLLCNFVNKFTKTHADQIFEESLIPTFATLPGFWSMMHGDQYLTCREYIFGGIEDEYAGLLARLDAYYESVSSRREEIIDGALESGVKLAVISNYNTPLAPVYESAKYHGDGMLETSAMAGGAVTSVIGGVLTDEQLAAADSRYVSADKCIDATDCLYRDYTWFIKDAGHVIGLYGSDCTQFLFTLLESEAQPDITTWAEYPQFMQGDADENITVLR